MFRARRVCLPGDLSLLFARFNGGEAYSPSPKVTSLRRTPRPDHGSKRKELETYAVPQMAGEAYCPPVNGASFKPCFRRWTTRFTALRRETTFSRVHSPIRQI